VVLVDLLAAGGAGRHTVAGTEGVAGSGFAEGTGHGSTD
jgi:hypothetical protein